MKITLVIITSLFVSIMLQASELEPSLMQLNQQTYQQSAQENYEPERDHYSTIKQWFEDGQNVRFEDVEGFYAGRCYFETTRIKPSYALLGVYKRLQNSYDHGPAFPDYYEKKVIALHRTYYKNQGESFDENSIDEAKDHLNRFWNKLTPLNYYEGTVSSTQTNSELKPISAVRRYENYYVSAWIIGKSHEDYHKGEITSVCYYFKKL